MEGNFANAQGFLVCHTSGTYTVPVCLNVDGFISDEGASEHVSSLIRCGVEGGGNDGGVPDHQSSGLDSVSEECPEFIVNGSVNAKNWLQELCAKGIFHCHEARTDIWSVH